MSEPLGERVRQCTIVEDEISRICFLRMKTKLY